GLGHGPRGDRSKGRAAMMALLACGAAAPPASDLVDGALVGHRHRAPERLLGLAARPVLVELVGDVGEHETAHAGPVPVVAGLARREVAARPLALRARQR